MDEPTYIPPDATNVDSPPHAEKLADPDKSTRARTHEGPAQSRTDPNTDERKRALAFECYQLFLKPMSFTRIAKRMNLHEHTVAKYVHAEMDRLADEGRYDEHREANKQQAITVYEKIRDKNLALLDSSLVAVADVPKFTKAVIDSQICIDKLRGLENAAPPANANPLSGLTGVQILEIVRLVAARKEAELKA